MRKFTLSLLCICLTAFIGKAQTFTNFTVDDGLVDNTVNALVVNGDDTWFGTQNGLSKYDGTNWTNYTTTSHPDMINNTILAVEVDGDGNVWIGTDFGVGKFDGTDWTQITKDDGLANNRISCIEADGNGNVWVGNSSGVSVYDGTNWTSYTTTDGLPFGGVSAIAFDDNGDTWLGTGLGGVFVYDGTDFTAITEDEGLLNDKVTSIAITSKGAKWVGTSDGISVFNSSNELAKNHTRLFELPEPDTLNPVTDVKIDSKGNAWVGVYVDYLVTEGGVSAYNGFKWQDFDKEDGLVGPVVRAVAVDASDNVWVATSTGASFISEIGISVDEIEQNHFSIYPNPARSSFNIDLSETADRGISTIQLYNAHMQLIREQKVDMSSPLIHVETADLSKGFYFVKAGNGVSRVVVE